jgi:hypothetical protein
MQNPRYLPANLVEAGSVRLGRVTVRARDNREIGTLMGFVVDENRIHSLIVQSHGTNAGKLELPMGPVQLDAGTRSLRMQADNSEPQAFDDSVPQIDPDDLWVPLIHSAA